MTRSATSRSHPSVSTSSLPDPNFSPVNNRLTRSGTSHGPVHTGSTHQMNGHHPLSTSLIKPVTQSKKGGVVYKPGGIGGTSTTPQKNSTGGEKIKDDSKIQLHL